VDVGEMSITIPTERLSRFYRKKIPKPLRLIVKWGGFIVLAAIADFLILYIATVLTAANLIDWKTVLSFLVVEVLAAVFAKMFRIGEPSVTEEKNQKIALSASRAQFSHLLIISLGNEGHSDDYPDSHYRVVNTNAKVCYWVPAYLEPLVEEEDILNEIVLKDESKWENYLKENRIRDKRNFPSASELEATLEKEEALYRNYVV
jgi:hypothetical protein